MIPYPVTSVIILFPASLESSGVLGKIKAQLRASVYIALEEGNVDIDNNVIMAPCFLINTGPVIRVSVYIGLELGIKEFMSS